VTSGRPLDDDGHPAVGARVARGDKVAGAVSDDDQRGRRYAVLAGDERLVQETVALAIESLESGQSHASLRRRLPGQRPALSA
jgi:hypothetical protein